MRIREVGTRAGVVAVLVFFGGIASCSLDETTLDETTPDAAVPSFEEFRDRAERNVDGETFYVVEWDIGLTLDELNDYYLENVASGEPGRTARESTVNRVGNADDVWLNDDQLRLTYCVSDTFGANKARAVSEMAEATRAWERVANVNFRYVPAHDAACSNANPAVVFSVRPWTGGGACAFFPSGGGCVPRTLVIDLNDLDTNPFYATNSPNVETVGVFRHELGHILGLRHEHTRPNSGVCFENNTWRAVTAYDQASVMHYPWCNGVLTSSLSITNLDRAGAHLLYPMNLGNVRDADEETDLNDDGRSDVCARGSAGVHCALSTGATFGALSLWHTNFSDANGWNVGPEYFSTIRFPDVNGDGRADMCGRGSAGIHCALGTGAGFGALSLWQAAFSDANGWSDGPEYYGTIRFPDLNNDGRDDVCGRGSAGVHCALSTGAAFGALSLWHTNFSDGNGWNIGPEYYGTIRFPDLNNDGRDDLCGRGSAGVHCALSTGAAFGALSLWNAALSDVNGWDAGPHYYSTIRFPDLNNDGRADLCGRGSAGVHCALSTGAAFGALSLWHANFSDANGWQTGPQYYSTISFADLNSDGRADLCGRGSAGIHCALSTGAAFGALSLWQANFSDVNGWNSGPEYYSTIRFRDLNGDGRADLCGRGSAGVHCAASTGATFGALSVWNAALSDVNGWNRPEYFTTIRLP